jgi:hypothetical protein
MGNEADRVHPLSLREPSVANMANTSWLFVIFDTALKIEGKAPRIAKSHFHASWCPAGHAELT